MGPSAQGLGTVGPKVHAAGWPHCQLPVQSGAHVTRCHEHPLLLRNSLCPQHPSLSDGHSPVSGPQPGLITSRDQAPSHRGRAYTPVHGSSVVVDVGPPR